MKFMVNQGRLWISFGHGYVQHHRWLWEQTHGPIPKGYVIHHKDGNKMNDDLSNLEMMTSYAHKSLHAKKVPRSDTWRKAISESHMGSKNPMAQALGAKNPAARSVRNLDTGEVFETILYAANGNHVLAVNIGSVCRGKRHTAGGSRWSYVQA